MNLPFSLHSRPRWVQLTASAGALAIAGLLAWIAIASMTTPRSPKVVANNISRNFRACLINDERDAALALPLWSALQKISNGAAINAQHITVPKGRTAASLPYVNSLVQRHCGLIISVGPHLHDAVTTTAQHNPRQQFITVGRSIKLPNVRTVSPADQSTLISTVQKAAHPHSPHRA